MGLDTTHDAWHGSYISFNTFRCSLAKIIDIDLGDLKGFGGNKEFPKDDLSILLDHSDCDGEIKWKDAKKLSKRLKELLPLIPVHEEYIKEKTKQFIKGCDLAVKRKESIEFH